MSKTLGTVAVPQILLPKDCDMQKWSVVACDQFTSDKAYWNKLDRFVGEAPSTLRLILPECYLDESDVALRQQSVQDAMRRYDAQGLFYTCNSFISVKRTFASGVVRNGLMAAIDLNDYDYRHGTRARIRATEGTVESRLPPRVQIRQKSLLELPHIMVLIDDPQNIVFSQVEKCAGETLYDFEENAGGGHITGKRVTDSDVVLHAFDVLADDMHNRYGEDLLMLVGDGNHSLAAAKQCYEAAKAAGDPSAECKRYALCEIVNLYDDGIVFEPIHRMLFGLDDPRLTVAKLQKYTEDFSEPATVYASKGEYKNEKYPILLPADPIEAVAAIQKFIDDYVAQTGCTVDYIHGEDALLRLGTDGCLAIPLPPITKAGFTEYILRNGVLPRKTFSMGNAQEKRYYLEARKLR